MDTFKEISGARSLLNLGTEATMDEIKTSYRNLLMQWHPDVCGESRDQCKEMTEKVVAAYRILVHYCSNYRFSFSKEAVMRHLSEEEWWFERFGHDPFWGK